MSSGEGASENHTAPENQLIETCHRLLKLRNFVDIQYIVHMNQFVSSKRRDELEKVRAISDVLIAAENLLPNGMMDYYGMLRMSLPGPVLLEDFKKLMELLDKRHNSFPFSEEAADKALLAWSVLSKPTTKAQYDLAMYGCHNRETKGQGQGGEGSKGGVDNGKGNMCTRKRSNLHESDENLKDISFIPKKRNVGPGPDDEVVVISDDDDDDDGQEIITMARAAKLCKVNGRRVKVIPLKKKKKKTNV